MEKERNVQGFHFNFESGNQALDSQWSEGPWEVFNHTASVPLVGDHVNFWYIFSEMGGNGEGLKAMLNDYKTAIFRVKKRTYCPLNHTDKNYNTIGTWCLYYLTLEPMEDEKYDFHLKEAERLIKSN